MDVRLTTWVSCGPSCQHPPKPTISTATALEAATQAAFYFATPHHAWERGTNENTNGPVRQYVPKRVSMAHLTQQDCTAIAHRLNQRPRKRLGYRTPEECYAW